MKRGYIKIIIFLVFLFTLLFLNSFISSTISKFIIVCIFALGIVLFKVLFGLEKDRHRFIKDICLDFFAVLLIYFIFYYLSGIFLGFVRTSNYLTKNGLLYFILPTLFMYPLREYLRYQILQKSEGNIIPLIISIIVFIFSDIGLSLGTSIFSSAYDVFIFIALYLLPSISSNIVCTYVAKRVGYKPNVLWLLIINLYYYFVPMIPNVGEYIDSLILLLLPLILLLKMMKLSEIIDDLPLDRKYRTANWILLLIVTLITGTLVYFNSGFFRYYVVSVGSGSMHPAIDKGDAVIIEKDVNINKYKINDVVAYKYGNRMIVHRLKKIVKDEDDYYLYTKGDNNPDIDNYPVKKDMVVGKVKIRIKYLGLPAVWLNNL